MVFNNIDKRVKKCIVWISNNKINPENDRVKSKHVKHHAIDFVKTTIVLFRDWIPRYINCKKDLYTLDTLQYLDK